MNESLDSFTSLKCTASTKQIIGYVMKKMELYKSITNRELRLAVTTIGLQDGTPKIWVLNSSVQYNADGDLINPDESRYIWLGDFLHTGKNPYVALNKYASCALPKKRKRAIRKLLKSLKECYIQNFPCCLLLLGAGILCLHYDTVMRLAQQVPAAIAFGDVSLGKSCATTIPLALLGVHNTIVLKQISNTKAALRTSSTSLGIVIDDPTDPVEISEKIMQHFGKGNVEVLYSKYKPKRTFISSMNEGCLRRLSKEQRYNLMYLCVNMSFIHACTWL